MSEWPKFRIHWLVKQKQAAYFNFLHDRLDPTSCLLQIDFSENAEILEQDEVQAAHWWHLQVNNKQLLIKSNNKNKGITL